MVCIWCIFYSWLSTRWSSFGQNGIQLMVTVNELPISKGIGISFSSFCILFTEGFSFTVDCHFGFQHWLQPGMTGFLGCPQLIWYKVSTTFCIRVNCVNYFVVTVWFRHNFRILTINGHNPINVNKNRHIYTHIHVEKTSKDVHKMPSGYIIVPKNTMATKVYTFSMAWLHFWWHLQTMDTVPFWIHIAVHKSTLSLCTSQSSLPMDSALLAIHMHKKGWWALVLKLP